MFLPYTPTGVKDDDDDEYTYKWSFSTERYHSMDFFYGIHVCSVNNYQYLIIICFNLTQRTFKKNITSKTCDLQIDGTSYIDNTGKYGKNIALPRVEVVKHSNF